MYEAYYFKLRFSVNELDFLKKCDQEINQSLTVHLLCLTFLTPVSQDLKSFLQDKRHLQEFCNIFQYKRRSSKRSIKGGSLFVKQALEFCLVILLNIKKNI